MGAVKELYSEVGRRHGAVDQVGERRHDVLGRCGRIVGELVVVVSEATDEVRAKFVGPVMLVGYRSTEGGRAL